MPRKNWTNAPLIERFKELQDKDPHFTVAKFAKMCNVNMNSMYAYLRDFCIVGENNVAAICAALGCERDGIIARKEGLEACEICINLEKYKTIHAELFSVDDDDNLCKIDPDNMYIVDCCPHCGRKLEAQHE